MREDELAPVDKVDIDRLLKEKPAWKELKGKLIEWADKANQVIEILQKMPLDDWLKLRRYYPKGLKGSAHVLNQKLVEAQKMTAGDALKFQKDEVSSKGMDPAENRANASVFADGRLIFMLNEPYLSGVKCTASEFGTLHAVVLNTPHTLALEKEISHNDSEVALLHDLDRQMTLHEPELKGAKEIVINIYSKLGACDPCKDRIDAFLLKHPSAVVRYYYRKYKPLDTSQESRKTSYGWEKDEKEKVGNKEVFVHEVHYSPKLDAVREGIDYVLQKTFAAVAVRLWTLKVWLIKVPTQPTGNANPISLAKSSSDAEPIKNEFPSISAKPISVPKPSGPAPLSPNLETSFINDVQPLITGELPKHKVTLAGTSKINNSVSYQLKSNMLGFTALRESLETILDKTLELKDGPWSTSKSIYKVHWELGA